MLGTSNASIIIGIDEAGRGSVLGPLVVAGVAIPQSKIAILQEQGVKDSKVLTKKARERLFTVIQQTALSHEVFFIGPEKIDKNHARGQSLNLTELEVFKKTAENLVARLPPNPSIKLIADAVDVNLEKCERYLHQALPQFQDIRMEYQADATYTVVAAASIIAKVTRDRKIQEIRRRFGKVGTGYPSDPITIKFLQSYFSQHGVFPDFVRTTWETCQKIIDQVKNQTLIDF